MIESSIVDMEQIIKLLHKENLNQNLLEIFDKKTIDESFISGIYIILNSENLRYYIGSSSNITKRFSVHKYTLRNNKHGNHFLKNDWNKCGENKFYFIKLYFVPPDREKLIKEEQKMLDQYAGNTAFCYNLSLLADSRLGTKDSEETKLLKSILFSGNKNPMSGRKQSKSAREKISKANKGKKRKPEQIKKGKENPNYGRKHSKESIEKMSKATKGKKRSEESRQRLSKAAILRAKLKAKPIIAVNRFTGEIKEFDSPTDASIKLDLWLSGVLRTLNGKIKYTNKWKFFYKEKS